MGDDAQLRLEPDQGATVPFVLNVPERLVKLLRRLEPSAAVEFALRAPVVVQQLLDEIIAVGQIPDDQLRLRLAHAQRDVDRLTTEAERRALARRTCASCHELDGAHLPGCEAAA